MNHNQVDFSRVRPFGETGTVSIDTSYIRPADGGRTFFATRARVDTGRPVDVRHWTIVETYAGRDQALAGHHKIVKAIRNDGFAAVVATAHGPQHLGGK